MPPFYWTTSVPSIVLHTSEIDAVDDWSYVKMRIGPAPPPSSHVAMIAARGHASAVTSPPRCSQSSFASAIASVASRGATSSLQTVPPRQATVTSAGISTATSALFSDNVAPVLGGL